MMKLNYFKSILLFFSVFFFVQTQAQVSGTVYLDGNNNGVKDTKEVGYPYLTVKAYTTGNTQVASAVTSVTGAYSLTGLTSGTKYRIEFESPSGYFNGAYGTGSSTSVQFITANATNVNYGMFVPAKCGTDPNPRLIGTNAMIASGSTTKSVISWRYQTDFYAQDHWGGVPIANGTVHPHSEDILGTQVGVPWAMSRIVNTKLIAMVPMASPESIFGNGGASGIDAVYMSDYSGASNAYSSSKTLVDFGTLGISVTATHPIGAIQPRFGEYGFGGVVNSSDGKYLYVSNLGKGNIARIDISGVDYSQLPVTAPTLANVTEINLPNTYAGFTNGTEGYFRATSMVRHAGVIYVAGTFDGSLLANNSAVRIVILKLNQTNNTFSEVFSYDPTTFLVGNFNYADVPQTRWTAGPDVSTSSSTHGPLQPIVNGFDFDDYGAIVLGVGDRAVYNLNTSNQTGYVISAWPNGSGGFTLESGGTRGTLSTFMSGSTFHNIYGAGPGGDLFFDQAQGHPFLYSGGILNLPGKNSLAMGITDPIGIAAFGVRYDRPTDGRVIGGIHLGGAKQFALVGVENVCDLDPIEVGNLVWSDTNDNGIQDGDEPAIAGITVQLLDASNTVIATATTDAKGYYIFSSDPNRTTTANFIYNITALTTKSSFKVRIPNVSGGSQQSALAGLFVTLKDADRDVVDNDASTVGVNAEIAFTTGTEGENKHDYDFGFSNVQSCTKPDAGADMTANGGSCINLTATTPTTGTWTAQAGNPSGATVGTTTSGIAQACFTGVSSGTYNFIYADGACEDTISVVVTPISCVCIGNLLTNPGFETGDFTGWTLATNDPGQTSFAGDNTYAVCGSKYAYFNPTAGNATDTVAYSQSVTAFAGQTFNLSIYAGVHDPSQDHQIRLEFYNSSNVLLSGGQTVQVDNNVNVAPFSLIEYTLSGVAPSGTATARVTGYVKGNYVSQSIALKIDNACLTAITPVCIPPSAGANTTACAGTCMDITGTNPTTGTWSAQAGNPSGATIGTTTSGVANVCFNSSASGTYSFIYNIGTSCEDTMSILVNPQTSNATTVTSCDTYTWSVNSQTYTTSGTYTATSTNANGCVHTETLNLTINNSTSNSTTASACNTYTWSVNSTAYTASGTYTSTSTNAAGCPHTETLNLTINVPTTSTTNASACPSSLPYSWNGQSISTAGTYTYNATNVAGCDSVATLVFTISATSTSTTNVAICNASLPYMWNGISRTTAGTYTYQTTGVTGCDSIATLNLSIAEGSVGNYVWSDVNNNGSNDEPTTTGINGVIVELWNATTNTLVSSTTTANDGSSNPGYYNFVICASGDYKVKFPTTNSGNNLTTQTTTTATDNNSDASITTGESPVFTIDVNGTGVAKDNNTIDAGYSIPVAPPLPACLGNYVFNDINHDGLQDASEVGVSGVTVSLLNGTTNAIMATLTTDAYGYYQFCGLTAGNYKVKFSLPTNYIFTGQNNPANDATDSDPNVFTGISDVVTLAAGDSNMTVDAGIFEPQPITATVGDRVWFDANENGLQDGAEYGVSGVTVSLYNCSNLNTPIATTITDAGGNYLFENVIAGSYSVGFSVPIGMVFTTQSGNVSDATNSDVNVSTERTACFNVVGGDHLTYIDAGIKIKPTTTVSLGDKVWNDVNQDGLQDATETGVQGVTVTLYDATGTNVISTTTTNGLGIYGFNGIPAGCYVVGFDLPSGYTRSLQNVGTDSSKNSNADVTTGMTPIVCLTAGQNNPTIDAGIYNNANTNSIGDKVWYDENKDGLQDVTEYGYPGVVATLYDCTTNTIIATTTTNASGNYLFDGIANGDYYVGFGFIAGYQFTGANADVTGIAGANNSDANPSNGLTSCVTLSGNTHITTVDAGIYPGSNRNATSSLGDIVWTDANNNGLQDNGETGVSNVTVNLYNCSDLNTPISTTTTDGLGNYIFTGLLGGSYVVEFNPTTLPAGYTFTTLGTNIEDENNSDANVTTGKTSCIALGLGEDKMSVDAGIVAPVNTVCLGDYVWIDLDNDGNQEANEPAVPGVTVKLYDNNTNTVLQVATTNSEGKYLFCGLTNGSTYSVGFENLPAGFTFTTQTGALNVTDNSDANPTTGRTTTVTLGATNDLTLDAGIYSSTTAVVGNYVWYDEDADGIQDVTEAPISGVLVTLYNSSNVSVASAVTDANGGYLFTNVTPGDYTIGFAGYPVTLVPTTKGTTNPLTADDDSNIDPITGKTDVFTVLPGSSNLTLDAGYKANPIAGLGNYVWLDVNDNGLQDASEPSISGVVVTLYAANGTTQLGTAITDGNGAYSFPNLTAGDYVVGFSNVPINYIVANQVGSLNDALNNDITTIDMKTAVITLAAGTYNPNIDAGFKFNPLGAKELKATSAVITSKNDCQVNWFTTDEENTQNFNITRSINGVNFETVGTILASNKTLGRTNYTFQDNIEAVKNAANIFYQIVLNDIDGKQTISNIISVKTNNTNDEISVYPVPFTNTISINYPSTEAAVVNVILTDVSGRTIKTMNQEIEQGNNSIQLNGLTNVANGTYFLQIVNNNTGVIYSKKLTK